MTVYCISKVISDCKTHYNQVQKLLCHFNYKEQAPALFESHPI
jgi:hypothetical protein